MADNTCTNKVNAISDTFEWKFKKFSFGNCEQRLLSPIFGIEIPNKVFKWQLKWYPRGFNNKDHSSLYLVSLNKFDIQAEFNLLLVDSKSKKLLRELTSTYIFRAYSDDYGYKEFINISLLKELRNFSIFCNITVSTKLNKIIQQNDAQSNVISKDRRLQELDSLEKLMENDEFSDVCLIVNGQFFSAHKCLLANKSPVFAAMFKHDMKEKESKIVIIEDIQAVVFKEILRFIYVGKVNEIESMAIDLYKAADKYSLESLKDVCIVILYDTISVINAVDYLEFADLYNLDDLRKKVSDFIVKNPKKFIDLPEFKEMATRNPELLFEVFRALAL